MRSHAVKSGKCICRRGFALKWVEKNLLKILLEKWKNSKMENVNDLKGNILKDN